MNAGEQDGRDGGEGREILGEGRYLRLIRRGRWEYVERTNVSGVIGIAALNTRGEMILVEQHRPPVGCDVIEIPAGLAGDIVGEEDESLERGARRELLEETGYEAGTMIRVMEGPVSAGMSTEVVTFFVARGLSRVGEGGGDGTENIRVHEIPLAEVDAWLARRMAGGVCVDPKVYAALYFLTCRTSE